MVFRMKLDGIDELEGKLDRIPSEVKVEDLLTDSFIARHSQYRTAQEFFDLFPGSLKELTPERLNAVTTTHTTFSTWDEMLQAAGSEYFEQLMR